jgi:hypothetical protein
VKSHLAPPVQVTKKLGSCSSLKEQKSDGCSTPRCTPLLIITKLFEHIQFFWLLLNCLFTHESRDRAFWSSIWKSTVSDARAAGLLWHGERTMQPCINAGRSVRPPLADPETTGLALNTSLPLFTWKGRARPVQNHCCIKMPGR